MQQLPLPHLRRFALAFGFVGLMVLGVISFWPKQAEISVMDTPNNTSETGIIAADGMQVAVHYQGRLEDGTVFDDSHKRGEPISFILGKGQVIKGWDQGIAGMAVGEKRTLTIPPELGYGAQGAGDVIPPNATLIFDVELVSAMVPAQLQGLDVAAFEAAMDDKTVLIDIRGEDEWLQTGIIAGAKTITAFSSSGGVHPEFLDRFRAVAPTPDTSILLYCHSAGRSQMLGRALVEQLGYKNVSHLEGGIVSWSEAGKETKPYQN